MPDVCRQQKFELQVQHKLARWLLQVQQLQVQRLTTPGDTMLCGTTCKNHQVWATAQCSSITEANTQLQVPKCQVILACVVLLQQDSHAGVPHPPTFCHLLDGVQNERLVAGPKLVLLPA